MRSAHLATAMLILALAVAPARAEAPSHGFDFELRQTLDENLDVALRRLADMRGAGRGETGGATFAATLATLGCAATDEAYWTTAWRWMIANTSPRLNAGTTMIAGPYGNDLREQTKNMEEAIAARAPPQFMAAGERAGAIPADAAAALRQRAEWATAIAPQIVRLKVTQEASPESSRYALAFAVWTRGYCAVRTGHAAAARAALNTGYPRATSPTDRTELAFAMLVAASGDTALAADALATGGDTISPAARRLIEGTIRR